MMDNTPMASTGAVPPVLEGVANVLADYDVVFSDVWGVVHDGLTAHAAAADALIRFRSAGGTVILVSNAPVPQSRVAQMLDDRRLPRTAWDAIVSSGDLALAHIDAAGYERLHFIGPLERDAALFSRVAARRAPLPSADALLVSGLDDDINETAESYRERLETALSRGIPLVCANPDLVVDVGGRHYLCAGAIADLYAAMGGEVFWAGKPHAVAYRTAHEVAERLREAHVDPDRILVIGDALRTDLEGARNFGVDALFVASGIHAPEVMRDGLVDRTALQRLFTTTNAPPARAAVSFLRW
ncbi:MAG: TIGR01459 family HAD-type hydrolase [Hyphomicrobiaceae bacterium]